MNTLPPNHRLGLRDAYRMFIESGLESITAALRHGHGFDLDTLKPLINRCRALVNAYDDRISEVIENDS